jgi:FkbM family methyltransferase
MAGGKRHHRRGQVRMTMISYAQNFEDVLLWRALKDIRGGAYVDVGACDPTEGSVTRWFYDRGWAGVSLEPIPDLHARLERERRRDVNIRAAAGAAPGRAEFRVVRRNLGYSSLTGDGALPEGLAEDCEAIEVEIVTLDSVLDGFDRPAIHFLKIDVEGGEAAVLAGLDLRRHRPWILLIEATAPGTQRDVSAAWRGGVEAAGYRHAWFDGLNRWFVAEEHAGLIERLALPPNVFDGFVTAQTHALSQQVGGALHDAAELRRSVEQAAARAQAAETLLAEAERRAADGDRRTAEAEQRAATAEAMLGAVHASVSWRVTAPLRTLRGLAGGR